MNEFDLIAHFLKPLAAGYEGAFSLSDDVACLSIPEGQELVITTDALTEGVHFFGDDPANEVARKMLRVNVSDIIAKGAKPFAYSLAMALPESIQKDWLTGFTDGLRADQDRYGLHLIGGDTIRTSDKLTFAVTMYGLSPVGKIVRRRSRFNGNEKLYVTGTIGDSALGLALLKGDIDLEDPHHKAFLIESYRIPNPPFEMAGFIQKHANAALDISDGLAADCLHLCRQSTKQARLFLDKIPLSAAASAALKQYPDLWPRILAGGDDYQILFSLENTTTLTGNFTEIGDFVPGEPAVLFFDKAGKEFPLPQTGWSHF